MKICPTCNSRYSSGEVFCPLDGSKLIETSEVSSGQLTGGTLNSRVMLDRLVYADDMAERYAGRLVDSDRKVWVTVFNQKFAPVEDAKVRVETARSLAGSPLPKEVSTALESDFAHTPAFIIHSEPTGPSVRELLDERGTIPWTSAVRITASVARVFQWLADQGILSRSIHPGAIFVTDLTQGQVQLGEWAYDALMEIESPLAVVRESPERFVGHVRYMAPEVANSLESGDLRSAVYALGVMLFEMVSGKAPIVGATAVEILEQHQNEQPLSLAVAAKGVELHDDLDDVIQMMMSKSPESRFQTPMAVIAVLSNLLDTTPDLLAPDLTRAETTQDDELYRTIDMDSVDRASIPGFAVEPPSASISDEYPIPVTDSGSVIVPSSSEEPVESTGQAVRGESETDDADDADASSVGNTLLMGPSVLSAVVEMEQKPASDVEQSEPASEPESESLPAGNESSAPDADEAQTPEQEPEREISEADTATEFNAVPDDADSFAGAAEEATEEQERAADSEPDLSSDDSTDGPDSPVEESVDEPLESNVEQPESSGQATGSAVDSSTEEPEDEVSSVVVDEKALVSTDETNTTDTPVEPETTDDGSDDESEEVAVGAALAAAATAPEMSGRPNTGTGEFNREWFQAGSESEWEESYAREEAAASEARWKTTAIAVFALVALAAVAWYVYSEYIHVSEPEGEERATSDEPTKEVKAFDVSGEKKAFDAALSAGKVIAPAGQSALASLKKMQRDAADSAEYKSAREAFVTRARADALKAKETGEVKNARDLAGYASQFAPEDQELIALRDELQRAYVGDSAPQLSANADAGKSSDESKNEVQQESDDEKGDDAKTVASNEVESNKTTKPKTDTKPKANGSNEVAKVEKAETKEASPTPPPEKAEKPAADVNHLISQAKSAQSRGNSHMAEKLYREALTSSPNNHKIHAGLGKIYFDRANYDKAVSHQKRAVKLRSKSAQYRITLGQSYFRLGQYKAAINSWESALKIDPNNSSARKYIDLAKRKLN